MAASLRSQLQLVLLALDTTVCRSIWSYVLLVLLVAGRTGPDDVPWRRKFWAKRCQWLLYSSPASSASLLPTASATVSASAHCPAN